MVVESEETLVIHRQMSQKAPHVLLGVELERKKGMMSSLANKHEDSSWLFTTLGSLELDFGKYELGVFDHDEI